MKKLLFVSLLLAMALPCFADSFTDSRDGQTYGTVKIGAQTWMAQNLNYQTGSDRGYKNDSSNCQKYGRLYKWESAVKACPAGWHLPSKSEFETLLNAAGGIEVAGRKLRSKSDWAENSNGTDAFGFNALPAGSSYYDGFKSLGNYAFFWSSTEVKGYRASRLNLFYAGERAFVDDVDRDYQISVRCLKDSD